MVKFLVSIVVTIAVMVLYILMFLVALEIVMQLLRLVGMVNKENIATVRSWNKGNITKLMPKTKA